MGIGIIGFILLTICFLAIGFLGNEFYTNWNNEIQIKGLWFNNWNNLTQVKEKAYSMDSSGEWVCINVNSKMSYQDCIDTATHECSHELFARKCEDNPEVCFKIEGLK